VTTLVAAVDFGGSGLRAAVYDPDGRRVGLARRAWTGFASPGTERGTEFDGPTVWALVADALAEVTAGRGGDVAGVAVTAVRLGCALIGDHGEIYCGPNIDGRARIEGLELWRRHGDALYRLSGHAPPVASASARLLWFARHQPERLRAATHLLSLEGWLAWRLTGVAGGEPAASAASGLLDVATRRWSEQLCDMTGADPSLLPPLHDAGAPVAGVTAAAAALTGVRAGAPVTIAGGDTHAGLLALGATEPGIAGIVAGATAPLMAVTDRWVHDETGRCWSEPHPLRDRWVVESNVGEVGGPAAWLATVMGVAVADLDALAARSVPGANGISAFLGPMAMHATDMPLLRRGGFELALPFGLRTAGPADVARAFLENVAFALRTAHSWAGAPLGERSQLRLGGGVSRIGTLARVLAGVVGDEVLVADDPEVTLRGTAAAAAAAAGWFASLREASAAFATTLTAVAPEDVETYDARYHAWSDEEAARVVTRFADL
jgi:sugar (pentulose or hexulose) kinase